MKLLHSTTCAMLLALAAFADAAPVTPVPVKLWRLDCGQIREDDKNDFSDTFAYVGQSIRLGASCYLIEHGDTYMLWDTGLPDSTLGLPLDGPESESASLTRTLTAQLKELGVEPGQIGIVGLSHYHFDHTGQASHFPQATVFMGKADVTVLRTPGNADAKPLEHWIGGPGKIVEVTGDKDVFADKTVIMLDLPGHTPGHHGLLVKLAKKGYVLLSGDLAHFRENYLKDGVPQYNSDRAQSLASLARFKAIATNLHATVLIQHEPGDIAKLPLFPAFAE